MLKTVLKALWSGMTAETSTDSTTGKNDDSPSGSQSKRARNWTPLIRRRLTPSYESMATLDQPCREQIEEVYWDGLTLLANGLDYSLYETDALEYWQ